MDDLEKFTNLSKEKLDEIFADPEMSRQFFTLFLFALAIGKSFEEVIEGAKVVCVDAESQGKDGARENDNDSN
jgi:hypothetical protein